MNMISSVLHLVAKPFFSSAYSCGGNSTKATSGINGANTKSQKALGIEDSVELFSSDCLKGGAKKPELVKVLATNSGPDCDWLMDVFGLDLSLVVSRKKSAYS